jgi:outer membrane protein assembly factor BamA
MLRRCRPFLLLSVFLCSSAIAQFKFERVNDGDFIQRPKRYSFYSTSRFNRVEGMFLGLGVTLRPKRAPDFRLFGDVGYGFKNEEDKRVRWNAGIRKDFAAVNRLSVGLTAFNQVYSQDQWFVSTLENSVAGFFLKEDFMDFVGRTGGVFYADYRFLLQHTVRAEIARYEYEILRKNTNWSLFGGEKKFPENARPLVPYAEGWENAFRLMAAFDWRDNPVFPIIGWYAEGIIEKTTDDFSTTGLFLTVKRHQPTWGEQKLQAKILFGSRTGSFAYQHLMSLGGVGSLRGFREKEFVGNRFLFGTFNYTFGQELLRRIPLRFVPLWDTLAFGVFADAGLAWPADPADKNAGLFDFGGVSWEDLRSDAGFSIIVSEGLLRVDFAKRTDRSDDAWRVTFRILDKF